MTAPVDRHADRMWQLGYRQGRADAVKARQRLLTALAVAGGVLVLRRGRRRRRGALRASLALLLIVAGWTVAYRYRLDLLAAGAVAGILCAAYAYLRWPPVREEEL